MSVEYPNYRPFEFAGEGALVKPSSPVFAGLQQWYDQVVGKTLKITPISPWAYAIVLYWETNNKARTYCGGFFDDVYCYLLDCPYVEDMRDQASAKWSPFLAGGRSFAERFRLENTYACSCLPADLVEDGFAVTNDSNAKPNCAVKRYLDLDVAIFKFEFANLYQFVGDPEVKHPARISAELRGIPHKQSSDWSTSRFAVYDEVQNVLRKSLRCGQRHPESRDTTQTPSGHRAWSLVMQQINSTFLGESEMF